MGRFSMFWRLVLGVWALSISPAFAETAAQVQLMIVQEALKSRVPPALALAVGRVESNFDEHAVSPVGARGVMQIMPKTARDVFGVGADYLWNARLNVRLGLTYLEQLYDQYGHRWDLALSHYNGGALSGPAGAAAIPHDYTRQYVADVLRWQRAYAEGGLQNDRADLRNAPNRIDPLEFDNWAEATQRRLAARINSDRGAAQ
jgi:soluble lytic murein transglycosylase-like protein